MVAIPSRRSLPPGLGICRSRTGNGANLRARSSARRSARKLSTPRPRSTSRAVRPSTPAVRAPLLPRTRCHATSSNAGSQTRLNRSSNRRSGSPVAHWCSLVWIPSTRACASSNEGVGCGAPVFTGDLLACQSHGCELTAPLPHVAGSPDRRVLRGLRHAPTPSADGGPARRRAGRTAGRAASGRFPRSLCAGRQGWCPAFPRQPRHGYAAGLPRGLLGRKGRDVRSRRHRDPLRCPACAADRPTSARFEPALPLAGVPPLVHYALHRPALLAGPGPSGSADPSRRCQGCSHPAWRLPGRAALSFCRAAATAPRWVLSPHPVTQRLVAHPLIGMDLGGPATPPTARGAYPGTSSSSAANTTLSLVLAAVTAAASGRSWPSVTRWSLDPGLPRSAGFAPTWSPHAWRARSWCPRRLASSPAGPARRAGRASPAAARRTHRPWPIPPGDATRCRRAAAKLTDREQPPWRGGTGHVDDRGQAVAIPDGASPAAIRGTGWSWDQRGDQLPQLLRDKLLNKRRGHG
jgi:hypothetical protein